MNNPFTFLAEKSSESLIAGRDKKGAKSKADKSDEKRILITGMPGIGNVGRLTAEYLVETLKPKEIGEITTRRMPTASFVQEDNLIILPRIRLYQKKNKGYRLFILAGDFQPLNEEDTFYFSEAVCAAARDFGIGLIITTGGIGLAQMPQSPKVYVTGPKRGALKHIEKSGATSQIYGIVGPIMGVSGILPIVSERNGIESAVLLAETAIAEDAVGLTSAKEMLRVISKAFEIKINFKKMEQEIKEMTQSVSRLDSFRSLQGGKNETSYIG